jgi:hypothetical protein
VAEAATSAGKIAEFSGGAVFPAPAAGALPVRELIPAGALFTAITTGDSVVPSACGAGDVD